MKKDKIDLSIIKQNDIDDTATFTDLLSKQEKKELKQDDIEDMINEKKRNTKDLTKEIEIIKEKEDLNNTKVFEIDKKDKETSNKSKKTEAKKNIKEKNKPTGITDVGIFILAIMAYFIYCLLYTNFYDNEKVLLINIITIVLTFLLFTFSIIFNKKLSKIIVIIIFILLLIFIAFNLINSLGFNII